MKTPIPIHLAVEDDLSESILRRVLRERPADYAVGPVFKRGGFGFLKKQSPAFNNMAKACPVLLLTDLDQRPCAPELIKDWLDRPKHPDFLLRVAVKEAEAWLLACDTSFGKFLALRRELRFDHPETLEDPKLELLKLAEGSLRRGVREAISRRDSGGNLRQGPAYNSTLSEFVNLGWKPESVAGKCLSFRRLLKALEDLETRWTERS